MSEDHQTSGSELLAFALAVLLALAVFKVMNTGPNAYWRYALEKAHQKQVERQQ